jgi:hypothetical protein
MPTAYLTSHFKRFGDVRMNTKHFNSKGSSCQARRDDPPIGLSTGKLLIKRKVHFTSGVSMIKSAPHLHKISLSLLHNEYSSTRAQKWTI